MKATNPQAELRPQPGPQERFLKTCADIAIFGGSAGGGKSYALLLEPLYHIGNPKFAGVIFRRTCPQLCAPGGLWNTSQEVYPIVGGKPHSQSLEWAFPSGATLKFSHQEHPKNRWDWQGAQVPFFAFDELCQFTADQFWYMLSRNRSMSGIKGYVRAATNPDPDSWVRQFIGWWIDPDTGLAIPERSGVLRWFVRMGDDLFWGDTREELVAQFGADAEPKSVTFIRSTVYDNRILLDKDPAYLSNLKALPAVERAQLLDGNWNIRATAGSYFKRNWFSIIDRPPAPDSVVSRVRAWDRAASELRAGTDPDASAGVLVSKDRDGIYYVEDVIKLYGSPLTVEKTMLQTAHRDGRGTQVVYQQEPGSAGLGEAQHMARVLDTFNVRFAPASGDKETRAKPVSAQAEAGSIKLVRGFWNNDFLRELENFPTGKHDDQADAMSLAYETLNSGRIVLVA